MEERTKASEGKWSRKVCAGLAPGWPGLWEQLPSLPLPCPLLASCGSHAPTEALGSVWNLLPLALEVGRVPGCPMNHLQREEIISLPSAVPALSLQIEPAAGNQAEDLSLLPLSCPAHRKWVSLGCSPSCSLAVPGGTILAVKDPNKASCLWVTLQWVHRNQEVCHLSGNSGTSTLCLEKLHLFFHSAGNVAGAYYLKEACYLFLF